MMANTFQIEIPNRYIGQNKNIDPKVVVKSITPTEMDWAGFERHLMSGQPYSFNRIARKKGCRHASGFQQASHIAMDSDKNATLAEILNPANPLAKHIRYVAPSPSDTSTYRKLRVIFPLAQPIYDKSVLTSTLRLISDEFLRFGVRFDPACVDVVRWYYSKETNEIADFDLNSHSIPSSDYCGILRLRNAQPLYLSTLADFAGEIEHRHATPTIHIADLDTFADLLEKELRQAGVLLERRDAVNGKVFCTLKLTHCHTSVEHEEKDNKRGAYSHANLTVWNDGGLTYHCYGGTCARKTIHHFLRKFNTKNKELKTALEESTRKSNYTPQLLVPHKYPHQEVVNERYLSNAISIQETKERFIILDSALGTGKTECLKNYVDSRQEQGQIVLTVIPRRTLGTQASLRFGVVDYQGENLDEMAMVRSRTVCIPSLNKLTDEGDIPEYDVLLIDEPSKVLQFFTAQGQGLFNPESPATHALECAKVLMEIGRKAKKIVIAEACMDQRVAWLFRRMFDVSLNDVRIVKNEYQEKLAVKLWGITASIRDSEIYTEVEAFFATIKRPWETRNRFRDGMKQAMLSQAVIEASQANIPLIIACDEKEDGAHGIRRFLIDTHGFSFDDILTVTSETKDSARVHAFLADPNGFIQTQKPLAIIHTAAMETGFSIEEPCGVVVVADGRNHTLDACALLQMIGRCRNPAFIHCLLDDRFRFESTDPEELITALITNHKYLEAKHKLNNQRMKDYQAWVNEIHGQLTAESNRQRMRLVESVPAFLEANGYDLQWIDPEAMIGSDCDFDQLVGDESLITARAIREERITRQETIIESEAISPDVASQHRKKKTLDEESVAGEKKGQLLELSGAEWVNESEGKLKDTLQFKRETAGLLKFVEKSSFDGEGKPINVPTDWQMEKLETEGIQWARLRKTKGFIVSSTFLEDIDEKSDEAWLSNLFVNNAVKRLKLHKPRNRRRFEAFCDLHTEPETLVEWDVGEAGGATPIRAFKEPRRQIVDYVKRLIEQIGEKSIIGTIWIRDWDHNRVNALGFELKSSSVLNIDRYIQARFEKDSTVEGFSISELVRSYFKSTLRMMDRGDYLGACRTVLHEYFYRIDTEYNQPTSDEKLFSLLPSISRKHEVKRGDDMTAIILDAKSCMTTLNRAGNDKIETVLDCLEWLCGWQVDGKPLGLVWFATADEKQIVGVPCRVYRSVAIDTKLEDLLLALLDTPLSENAATDAEIQKVKDHVKSTANFQKAQKTRTDALARIESVIKDTPGPLSIGEIANKLNLELDESHRKAIQRRLLDLLRQGKIAKTGSRAHTRYFTVLHEKEEQVSGAEVSFGTKQPFLNREDLIQNDHFVPKESSEIAEGPKIPASDQAVIPPIVETESKAGSDPKTTPPSVSLPPRGFIGDICYVINDEMINDALNLFGDTSTIGLDFETYADCGIDDPLYVKKASPRVLSVSDGTRAVVFDCACLSLLVEKLREWLASKTVVCHNAQFDLAFLSRWGVKPKQVIDTMIMESVVLGAEGEKGTKTLLALCEKYMNQTLDKTEQQADWSPNNVLTDEMIQYAATDAKVLIPLRATLDKKIAELGMDERAYLIFCNAIPAFVESKLVGMPVDVEKTQELHDRLFADAQRIKRGLILDYGQYGYTTANSSKKIARVLQQAFRVQVQSTSREVLTQLALNTENSSLKTFCEDVLGVRRLMKTATELQKYISSAVDGRIHANYRIGGAISGRTTSSNPNLQQVSKTASVEGLLETGEIRRCFVAPEGYQFVTADYSQIELVLNAIHCGDDQMLSAFRNGTDIHTHTASQIFGKPLVEVSKEERHIGKSANFGLQYGMGTDGFRGYARSYGIRLSQAEASRIRQAWFASYPKIAVHHSQVKSLKPQTVHTITGRSIHPKRFTDALNLPIQGSGADLLNHATAIIHDRLAPFEATIVTFVHDELVVLVSETEAEAVAEVVKRGMAQAGENLYPEYEALIRCEVEIRRDWSGLEGEISVSNSLDSDATVGKSDEDLLLNVWEQKHPYEMHHREQVIDMAIYAGLFISVSGREAKWKAIEPSLIRWEDEGKITAGLGGMYQINPLKFENLR